MPDVDFDAARERRRQGRGFIFGGERFGIGDIDIETYNTFIDLERPDTLAEQTATSVAFVLEFLPDDDHDRFRKVMANKEDPITQGDLTALTVWLIEQAAARPTLQPSNSRPTRAQTQPGSEGARHSQVVVPTG